MAGNQSSQHDRRGAFRAAVGPEQDVTAHLIVARKRFRARLRDVSADGMYIELECTLSRPLKLDTMVDVEIAEGREQFVLYGVIRSVRPDGYGVHFPERDPTGRFNPLGRLAKIALEAQRTSVAHRLRALRPWH